MQILFRVWSFVGACVRHPWCDRFQGWIFPIFWIGWMVLLAPLDSALQLGADEHFELMKGFQVSLGHELYAEIWNDQPPLHTGLLAVAFRVFGPSILVARVLAVLFGALLLFGFFELIRAHSGRFAAWAAMGLLLASPNVLFLSASVMLEPAMLSLGILSCWAFFKSQDGRCARLEPVEQQSLSMRWICASGLLMGFALQVKLTAVIFIPAILFELVKPMIRSIIASRAVSMPGRDTLCASAKRMMFFGGSLIGAAMLVWVFFPEETFTQLLYSHFAEGTREEFSSGHIFSPLALFEQSELVVVGLLGVVMLIVQRRWEYCFPVILLLTVLIVHTINRPFWLYYNLHFWVPLAWLGGAGIAELFQMVFVCRWEDVKRWPFKPVWVCLVWSFASALGLSTLPFTVSGQWSRMIGAQRIDENPIVEELIGIRSRVEWIYTDRSIYAFHAGIPLPPELVVLAKKRFASGQISKDQVFETVKEYRPGAIYLNTSELDVEWQSFLEAEYEGRLDWNGRQLLIRNSLPEE